MVQQVLLHGNRVCMMLIRISPNTKRENGVLDGQAEGMNYKVDKGQIYTVEITKLTFRALAFRQSE